MAVYLCVFHLQFVEYGRMEWGAAQTSILDEFGCLYAI